MAKDYVLEKRKYVIGGVALAIVLIYLLRLFSLQIATDDYKKNADSNAFLNKIQYPSRGAMYDRNDKLLVFNQPAYDITMVPKEVENLDTPRLVPDAEYHSCTVSEDNERYERSSQESRLFTLHQSGIHVSTFGRRMWRISGEAI